MKITISHDQSSVDPSGTYTDEQWPELADSTQHIKMSNHEKMNSSYGRSRCELDPDLKYPRVIITNKYIAHAEGISWHPQISGSDALSAARYDIGRAKKFKNLEEAINDHVVNGPSSADRWEKMKRLDDDVEIKITLSIEIYAIYWDPARGKVVHLAESLDEAIAVAAKALAK